MRTENTFAQEFCNKLFERGIETYDRETKEAGNLGGASFRFRRGGLSNPETSGVKVFDERLNAVLRRIPARLFTIDRVVLNEDGTLPPLGENGYYAREMNAFMLYHSLDHTDVPAKNMLTHLREIMPEFAPYISSLDEVQEMLLANGIATYENGRAVFPEIQVRDVFGLHSARLYSCIIFALPSGPEANGGVWGYVQTNVPEQEVTALNAIPAGI